MVWQFWYRLWYDYCYCVWYTASTDIGTIVVMLLHYLMRIIWLNNLQCHNVAKMYNFVWIGIHTAHRSRGFAGATKLMRFQPVLDPCLIHLSTKQTDRKYCVPSRLCQQTLKHLSNLYRSILHNNLSNKTKRFWWWSILRHEFRYQVH